MPNYWRQRRGLRGASVGRDRNIDENRRPSPREAGRHSVLQYAFAAPQDWAAQKSFREIARQFVRSDRPYKRVLRTRRPPSPAQQNMIERFRMRAAAAKTANH
jgi:hypothetical protein